MSDENKCDKCKKRRNYFPAFFVFGSIKISP